MASGAIIGVGDGNLIPFSVVVLAPSKKTNVLFLEKIASSRVIHARVCCMDSARRKTNKMASEITFVGDEEIQFLSSVSLPNLRQAVGENFLDSDSYFEDQPRSQDFFPFLNLGRREDFPVRRMKRFTAERRRTTRKQIRANQAGKGRRHPENIFPLRTYRNSRAAAKTVKRLSKHGVKKSYALINRHFFHYKRKY